MDAKQAVLDLCEIGEALSKVAGGAPAQAYSMERGTGLMAFSETLGQAKFVVELDVSDRLKTRRAFEFLGSMDPDGDAFAQLGKVLSSAGFAQVQQNTGSDTMKLDMPSAEAAREALFSTPKPKF